LIAQNTSDSPNGSFEKRWLHAICSHRILKSWPLLRAIAKGTFDCAKRAVAVLTRVGGMGIAGEWQTRLRTSNSC
jgi:hypothetical protein